MASLVTMASPAVMSGSSAFSSRSPFSSTGPHRGLVVITNASTSNMVASSGEEVIQEKREGAGSSRRDWVFGAAAAAAALACSVGVAIAEEPKRGSAEAKKAFTPVCVSNPTARICRN